MIKKGDVRTQMITSRDNLTSQDRNIRNRSPKDKARKKYLK